MNILPRHADVVIPIKKFVRYCLSYEDDYDKAKAFNLALGYSKENAESLIENIRANLPNFPATKKGDSGHGTKYEVIMRLVGLNNKTAWVLTAWIDDNKNGEMRLTSAYVITRKGDKDDDDKGI